MKCCKNCKHWKKDICDRVVVWDGDDPFPDKWHKDQKSKMFGIEYFVHDDSGLDLYFKTGPDFGCNQFLQKKE